MVTQLVGGCRYLGGWGCGGGTSQQMVSHLKRSPPTLCGPGGNTGMRCTQRKDLDRLSHIDTIVQCSCSGVGYL